MKLKEKLTSVIEQNKKFVQNFGVWRIGIFGSVVREEETELSDIDLLVEFLPGKKNYDNFINLCFFLEGKMGKKVELVTRESLNLLIWKKIEKELEYFEISTNIH